MVITGLIVGIWLLANGFISTPAHAEEDNPQVASPAPHLLEVEIYPAFGKQHFQKITIENLTDHDVTLTNVRVNEGDSHCHLLSTDAVKSDGRIPTVPKVLGAEETYIIMKYGCGDIKEVNVMATETYIGTFKF